MIITFWPFGVGWECSSIIALSLDVCECRSRTPSWRPATEQCKPVGARPQAAPRARPTPADTAADALLAHLSPSACSALAYGASRDFSHRPVMQTGCRHRSAVHRETVILHLDYPAGKPFSGHRSP
jgi:hypothetical protein